MNRASIIASRIFASVVGGYAATVGVVAFTSILLALLFGMQRSEAVVLMSMIGFVGYAAVIIWGLAEPRLVRLWAVLIGVALGSHFVAIWLAALLPASATGG